MRQAGNEQELRAALAVLESNIQITASFDVATQIGVSHAVTLFSGADGPFTLYKSPAFSGSLFRVNAGGTLILQALILDGSKAGRYTENDSNRSLVLVAGGLLHLDAGAVLQNNSSYQEGGGVYLSGDVGYTNALIMEADARIAGCESRTSGGGLMVALRNAGDSAVLSGQAILENNTARDGGGIYLRSYLESVGGSLTLADQVRITGNIALANGGGMAVSSYRTGGTAPVCLTVGDQAVIDGNQAVHGGGIYFYGANSEDRLILTGASILRQNAASGNGGGVFASFPLEATANVELTGAAVTANSAGVGGGLYLLTAAGGQLLLDGSNLVGNQAGAAASGSGGGLWIQNSSRTKPFSLSVQNSTVTDNSALADGGGLAIRGGSAPLSVVLHGSTVAGNAAQGNGGGLLAAAADGAFALSDVSFDSNSAAGSGGGLYLSNTGIGTACRLDLTQSELTGNTAGQEGGGLRIASGSGSLKTFITDCVIRRNAADGSGGGIWNGGTHDMLTLVGSTDVSYNRSVAGNGGGIYFNSDAGVLTLRDQTAVDYNRADERLSLTGNHGGGVSVVPGEVILQDDAEISHNSAAKFGGGLSASETSVIRMHGGAIRGNASALAGGGVYNHAGSAFYLTGGSVCENSASVGGGIYNDALLTVAAGGILGAGMPNTAIQAAPGIYNSGIFRTEGVRDLSNGLYIQDRTSVARLTGPLAPESVIQLDRTGYVIPDPTLSPIVVGEATDTYPLLVQTDADGFRKPEDGFMHWAVQLSEDRSQVLLVFIRPETHIVNYHGNDAQGAPAWGVPAPQRVEDGAAVRLAEASPARDGYRFSGWNTFPGGTGRQYLPGDILSAVTADLDLYAQWIPRFPTPLHPPARLCCQL